MLNIPIIDNGKPIFTEAGPSDGEGAKHIGGHKHMMIGGKNVSCEGFVKNLELWQFSAKELPSVAF